MATYRGNGLNPVRTGDVRKDISRLFDSLYEMDEEFRYLFGHLDLENFSETIVNMLSESAKDPSPTQTETAPKSETAAPSTEHTEYLKTYRWTRESAAGFGQTIWSKWSLIESGYMFAVYMEGSTYGSAFMAAGYKEDDSNGRFMAMGKRYYTQYFSVTNGSLSGIPQAIQAVTVTSDNSSALAVNSADINLYPSYLLNGDGVANIFTTNTRYNSSYGYGVKVNRSGCYLVSANLTAEGTTVTGMKTLAVRRVTSSGVSSYEARSGQYMQNVDWGANIAITPVLLSLAANDYLSLYVSNQVKIASPNQCWMTVVYVGS